MKSKILLIVSIIAILFSENVSAQYYNDKNSSNPSEKSYNLQINNFLSKSKKQKNLAWIFLGGGLVLNTVGSSALSNSYAGADNGSEALAAIGSIATIVSIPLFFSSSSNKNKAQLLHFEKNVATASSDSLKRIYLEDAAEYFSGKASGNTITAIVLSAVGGAFIIAGISRNKRSGYYSNDLDNAVYTAAGITFGALSIPFYVRAASLKRTANVILQTGRIPQPGLTSISTSVNTGQYVAIGIRVQL